MRGACVEPGELVVEIGAGGGRLTAELARVARRVIAVERDALLARRLRDRWPNVDVDEIDALVMRLPLEPFRVVANLPFSVTNAALHLLFDDPRIHLTRADLIVQWGVAIKRGVPWPSTVNDVVWGAFYEASIVRRIPRTEFVPPPTVDTGLLTFRRRPRPLVPIRMSDAYRTFVARGFRHGPHRVVRSSELRKLGTSAVSARELDAHQWARLFALSVRGPNG